MKQQPVIKTMESRQPLKMRRAIQDWLQAMGSIDCCAGRSKWGTGSDLALSLRSYSKVLRSVPWEKDADSEVPLGQVRPAGWTNVNQGHLEEARAPVLPATAMHMGLPQKAGLVRLSRQIKFHGHLESTSLELGLLGTASSCRTWWE